MVPVRSRTPKPPKPGLRRRRLRCLTRPKPKCGLLRRCERRLLPTRRRRLLLLFFATMKTPPVPADCLLCGLRLLRRRRGPDPDGLTTRIFMYVSLLLFSCVVGCGTPCPSTISLIRGVREHEGAPQTTTVEKLLNAGAVSLRAGNSEPGSRALSPATFSAKPVRAMLCSSASSRGCAWLSGAASPRS